MVKSAKQVSQNGGRPWMVRYVNCSYGTSIASSLTATNYYASTAAFMSPQIKTVLLSSIVTIYCMATSSTCNTAAAKSTSTPPENCVIRRMQEEVGEGDKFHYLDN